jgi:two-component system response regulator AtoC
MATSTPASGRDRALVICPQPTLQPSLCKILETLGVSPVVADSMEEAGRLSATSGPFSVTVVDVGRADGEGLETLRRSRLRHEESGPVVVLAHRDDPAWNSKAELVGAEQVVLAPWTLANLQAAIVKVVPVRPRSLDRDSTGYDEAGVRLRQELALWRSPKMRDVLAMVQQSAGVDITVLIGGETGTGKELVARAIHHLSPRRDHPFVKVNCAAVPADLLESELFGHERGAFTGAHQLRVGKFEAADRGVVFLDEIGDLHLSLQAKLLHVLQDGAFSRVGGRSTLKADVRIVAATNRDLEIDVAAGRFREDLYYRLNVVQIVVPPLRERNAEVPLLTDYFVKRDARLFGRVGFAVSPVAMERLMQHQYPGNVRELENIVKRMVVLNDPLLERVPLGLRKPPIVEPSRAPGTLPERASLPDRVSLKEIARAAARAAEREAIARVLKETRWNRVRAAKLLGISYRALLYKIKDVGLASEHALQVGS